MKSFTWTKSVTAHDDGSHGSGQGAVAAATAAAIGQAALPQGGSVTLPVSVIEGLAERFSSAFEPLEVAIEFVTTSTARVRFDGDAVEVVPGRSMTAVKLVSSQTTAVTIHPGVPQELEFFGYLATNDFGGSGDIMLRGSVRVAGQAVDFLTIAPFPARVDDNAYHHTVQNTSGVVVHDGDVLEVTMTGDPV